MSRRTPRTGRRGSTPKSCEPVTSGGGNRRTSQRDLPTSLAVQRCRVPSVPPRPRLSSAAPSDRTLACLGSARARRASSGPTRTIRVARCTPQHMFPCSKKVIPPNIFLSATSVRLPRWARMRAASFSSNAIGPLAWWKRMPVRPPNDLRISCKRQTPRPHNHFVPLSTSALTARVEPTSKRLSAACAC
jgi:hypothetical protein